MPYGLEAAATEGGRHSKGCYGPFLVARYRVYSTGSNLVGTLAISTCKVLSTPYFPVQKRSLKVIILIKHKSNMPNWAAINYFKIPTQIGHGCVFEKQTLMNNMRICE